MIEAVGKLDHAMPNELAEHLNMANSAINSYFTTLL
jgi:hypothetical protein